MDEISITCKKIVLENKEHTYAQCKENMCRIWTLDETFPREIQVSSCKDSIARQVIFKNAYTMGYITTS
jgi:hypothetical protein